MNRCEALLLHAYPLLLSVCPVLLLAGVDRGQVTPEVVVAPVIASAAITLLVLAVLAWLYGSGGRAALATLAVLSGFFPYGHVNEALKETRISVSGLHGQYALVPADVVLLLAALRRTWRRFERMTQLLTTLTVFLAVMAVVRFYSALSTNTSYAVGGAPTNARTIQRARCFARRPSCRIVTTSPLSHSPRYQGRAVGASNRVLVIGRLTAD